MEMFSIITFLLVTIQSHHLISGEEISAESVGGGYCQISFSIPKDTEVESCRYIFSGFLEGYHELYPKDERFQFANFRDNNGTLTFECLRIFHFGKWTIETKYKIKKTNESRTQRDILHFYDAKNHKVTTGTEKLYTTKGEFIDKFLAPDVLDDTICELNIENKLMRKYGTFKNKTYDEGDAQFYQRSEKGCGFRVPVEKKIEGKWRISGIFGYKKMYTNFVVKVLDVKETKKIQETWTEGSPITIGPPQKTNSIPYCQLQQPTGENITLDAPGCTQMIGVVSKSHAGTWIFRYASEDELSLNVIQYDIKIQDSSQIGRNPTPTVVTDSPQIGRNPTPIVVTDSSGFRRDPISTPVTETIPTKDQSFWTPTNKLIAFIISILFVGFISAATLYLAKPRRSGKPYLLS